MQLLDMFCLQVILNYSNLQQTVKGGTYSNCQNTNNATCIGLPRESFSTGGVSVEVLKAKERILNHGDIEITKTFCNMFSYISLPIDLHSTIYRAKLL